ncbi:hypothetical protein [Ornithinibacillus sp. FSL M8-0202]
MSQFKADYLNVILAQFQHFKERAEMGFQQLSEDDFHWKPNGKSTHCDIN